MIEEDLLEKQYNLYPYPPIPVGEMEDEILYSTDYEFVNYICTKKYKRADNIRILDAGCGTGYSTLKLASQNPNAKIIAIDISKSSLEIAKERLQKANLYSERIEFYNADLEDLSFLNEKFDYIVSTGVLHHLKDPEKGLENLKNILLPEGILHLMLYGEHARYKLKLFRKLIDIIREDSNDFEEGIEIGKELLSILPNNNSIKLDYINSYKDYFSKFGKEFADSKSQFIDAYLNAREKTYKIEEVFDLLEKYNLKLIKFLDDSIRNKNFLFSKSPLLSKYAQNLSEKDIYKISEVFFPERNFAFFCTHNSFDINNNKKEIREIKLSKFNRKNNNLVISATGKGLQLLGMYKYIYQEIEKENKFDDICENVSYKFYCDIDKSKKIVTNFIYEMENCDLIFIME